MKRARRKRSELTEVECLAEIKKTALMVQEMETSTQGLRGQQLCPNDCITLVLCAKGTFGTHAGFWEAMKVLGGFKLPRKV